MNLVKTIRIAVLKRQTVELYGKIQYYSGKIKSWQESCEKIFHSNMNCLTNRDYQEKQGSISYYTKQINYWRLAFESKKLELESLGVKVDLII